jgi:hypothetical protein
MPFGGALISAGTSILGGILGGGAASRAAKAQAAANTAAANQVEHAAQNAVDAGYAGITQANAAIGTGTTAANTAISNAGTAQQNIYNTETGTFQPYQAAGTQALSNLQATAGTFHAPTAAEAAATPGYQFQLQQGEQALQSSAAGRGMLQSGSTLKAMDQYSQGLASTNYQNVYNNALSAYNTNQAGMQNLANLGMNANSQALSAGSTYGGQMTSLAGLSANTNMQGAGLLANVAQQGNQYVGNAGLQGATTAGNFTVGAGNASAAGTMGQANAWGSTLNSLGNLATTTNWGGTSFNPFAGNVSSMPNNNPIVSA